MVSGDGIYSRYLTQYHGAGRYSFDISVHDNHHQAFTIRPALLNQQSNDEETFGGGTQCSKIGKKCNFKSAKTHYLHFQKWQKNQFLHQKKV